MINIVFFAALREQLGCEKLSITSDEINTVADIKKQLATTNEKWQQVFSSTSLLSAVNHDMVPDSQLVKAGDEVAFFPPVTGG